jgi:hypothetical protein
MVLLPKIIYTDGGLKHFMTSSAFLKTRDFFLVLFEVE